MGGSKRLNFAAHALWVFLALRLADAVNIASGMWFVPKYVSGEDIGAVLPLSTFATFLSLPLFAFAMTAMKESAVLVNVARGPVVNEEDLYTALTEGMIAGAGLDVLTKEPMEKTNPLGKIKDSEKLIITPHMAWASEEARKRLVDSVAENIEAFQKGNQILHRHSLL